MSWAASETGSEILALGDAGDDGISAVTYDSDSEKIKKKKSTHRPPKSPKSPYLSSNNLCPKKAPVWRSLKGTGVKHTENPMVKMPRNLWLSSVKQGTGLTQPLKSDFDTGQAWTGSASNTPEYLKQALGMRKPKYSRSASNGYIPGTPDFKEKEDMYDEIIGLKKTIQAQKSEADCVKTKLRRLEEENNKKDRQIEQLLDLSKSHGSEFSRSLGDKRSDTSLIVNGLKQKILRLEQQCKEKDNSLNKLQTDLKATSLEEMRIAMETYYAEIQRMQQLLTKAETKEKKFPAESKTFPKTQKALATALMRLTKNVKELQQENQSLKVDLEQALGGSPTSNRSKDYSEWSKQRLVKRISELEQKLSEPENTKTQTSDLANSTNSQLNVQTNSSKEVPPDSDVDECERLRGLIKVLKGDRSALQSILAEKDTETKQLQQIRNELERELRKVDTEKEKGRKEIQQLAQKLESLEKEKEEKSKERPLWEHFNKKESHTHGTASPASRPASAQSAASKLSRPTSASSDGGREDRRREKAAETIQAHWKQYKANKEIDALDKVATALQAAFRGHLAREQMASDDTSILKSRSSENLLNQHPSASHSNSSSSLLPDANAEEEAVTILQSALRAHLARLGQPEESAPTSVGARKSSSTNLSDKKSPVPSPRPSSSKVFGSSAENDTDVDEDFIEEPVSEEDDDIISKKPQTLSPSSRQSSSAQLHHRRQPSLSPPPKEYDSDDSDDIIISPSLPSKRHNTKF